MKKIAIGAWPFELYPAELLKKIKALGFEGEAFGNMKPHGIHPDDYDTPERCAYMQKIVAESGLTITDYGLDCYAVNPMLDREKWIESVEWNIEFAKRLNITNRIRVDTGYPALRPLPSGKSYEYVKKFYVKSFKQFAKKAASLGFEVLWEFEPGFLLNEPANVVQVVKEVDEPNFSLTFDFRHAYGSANGLGAVEKGLELEGGILEFIDMCKDRIGLVHFSDTDGKLEQMDAGICPDENGVPVKHITTKAVQLGKGKINYDKVLPALIKRGNYTGEWLSLDLFLIPFEDIKENLIYAQKLNEKYCK